MRKHFPFIFILLLALWSCDDDDNNKNNTNNTNNNTCNCGISIDSINGMETSTISTLTEEDDDSDVNTDGFQINVVVSVDSTAECVPEDGAEVTLHGGNSEMTGTLSGGQVTFTGYTIHSGAGTLELYASVSDCTSETTDIRLSTNGIPSCSITDGVSANTQYSCPADDEVPGQIGLQRLITATCVDVPEGTTLTFLVDGNEQTTSTIAVNGEAQAQITLPVTATCADSVIVSIAGTYNEYDLSNSVATGQACCEGVIPCNLQWTEGTEYVTGTPAGHDTLNVSTDGNTAVSDHQSTLTVHTDSSNVDHVAVLVDDGSGTFSEVCGSTSVSSDNINLDCTIPDGSVEIRPVCYVTGETDYFNDPSQNHIIYVDTVAPGCPDSFSCNVTDYHNVNIDCNWNNPGSSGDEDIYGTEVRYDDSYDATQCATDEFGLFQSNWSNLTLAPGYSTTDATGAAGDAQNESFSPFVPGPGYCLGSKAMDIAGNLSECTSRSWSGSAYTPDATTIPGFSDYSQFGTTIGSADLNCDGKKDLIIGAPGGYEGGSECDTANGWYATSCEGDGKAFIFFALPNGGYNSTPDITISQDETEGHDTYYYLGATIYGIGNFSRHIDNAPTDSSVCEDVAISSIWHKNSDNYKTGEVYILKGRLDWSGITDITTSESDPNGFDLVIKYSRDSTEYADSVNLFEEMGTAVSPIGDFNGDGFGDIAISAPGALPAGAVYGLMSRGVPFKNGTDAPVVITMPLDSDFTVFGASTLSNSVSPYVTNYEWLGASMSSLGDMNGDGFDDMIIGAPGCGGQNAYGRWGGTTNSPGKVLVILGGSLVNIDTLTYSGTRLRTITQDTGNIPGTQCFGTQVAGLGDFNDDGNNDFAISDKKYDIPGSTTAGNGDPLYEGAVFIYFGNGSVTNMLSSDAGMKIRSEWELTKSDYFGISVAPSVGTLNSVMGDFNDDGIPDLLVGAQHFGAYHGSAFAWYGNALLVPNTSPTAWNTYEEATFWFTPPSPNGYWGITSAWLGDINDDGYSDIAVGDSVWDGIYAGGNNNPYRGRVTIIY